MELGKDVCLGLSTHEDSDARTGKTGASGVPKASGTKQESTHRPKIY